MKKKINIQIPKVYSGTIVLAILVLAGIAGIVYWHGNIHDLALKVKTEKQEYNNELRYAQTITQLKRDLVYAEEVKEFINSMKIDILNPISFIEFIENLGDSAGVDIELKTFQAGGDTDVNIDIEARGTWRGVNTFILMLENVPYYLDISNVKVSSLNEEWVVNVRAKGYSK